MKGSLMAINWASVRAAFSLFFVAVVWALAAWMILALVGCRSYTYRHGSVEFKTRSFLSNVNVSGLTFAVDPDTGVRTIVVESYTAEHAAGRALADLAAKGGGAP